MGGRSRTCGVSAGRLGGSRCGLLQSMKDGQDAVRVGGESEAGQDTGRDVMTVRRRKQRWAGRAQLGRREGARTVWYGQGADAMQYDTIRWCG